MPGHGLIHAFRFDELHEPKLHSVVAVFLLRLLLHDDTGTCLNDGYRNSCSVIFQQLRHPDLFSQQAGNHFVCSRPNALISTSTPAGKSNFISASTVCGVGSRMSSSRLCVRISNCSRDFLSTCGERRTVNLLMMVGRGIGPATRAPVRFAVSTISDADWSSTLESYAFSRIRIFSLSIIDIRNGHQKAQKSQRFLLSLLCLFVAIPLPQATISVTVPAPTVRPPSRIANRNPFSNATGVISSSVRFTLSPGMTISTPSGSSAVPVTSVVRK